MNQVNFAQHHPKFKTIYFYYHKGLYQDFRFDHECRREFHSLSGLKNLEFLQLVCFSLIGSPFEQLTRLRNLSLNNCDFKTADTRLFADVANLEVFDLRHPQNYAHVDFGLLSNLKWLSIENTESVSFLPHLSLNLRVLKLIESLKGNFLGKQNFQHHPSLVSLDLFDSEFTSFDAKCLSEFPELKHLKLGPFIKELNLDYTFLSRLESLDLENNHFECLDYAFNKLANLKSLKLNYNEQLLVSSNTFVGLKSLEVLEMIGLFHENLSLSADLFRDLGRLTSLNISRNQLIYLDPNIFSHMPLLERLDLSYNFLQLDLDTFANLKRLRFLDLSGNRLGRLYPEVFKHLSDLDELNLSANRLCHITRSMWKGLGNLRKLFLNQNPIESIDPIDFLTMKKLDLVELTRTNLSQEKQFYIENMLKPSTRIYLDIHED